MFRLSAMQGIPSDLFQVLTMNDHEETDHINMGSSLISRNHLKSYSHDAFCFALLVEYLHMSLMPIKSWEAES